MKGGTVKVKVKNRKKLEELRNIHPGEWKKVYQDGYSGKDPYSKHFFEHKSGYKCDVKYKPGHSNR